MSLLLNVCDGMRTFHERAKRRRVLKAMPLETLERHTNVRVLMTVLILSGLERVALIDRVLFHGLDTQNPPLEWSPFQIELFSQLKRISIAQLVPAVSVHASQLRRDNGWEDLNTLLLVSTARQMGKSTALYAFAVAFCVAMPNARFLLFTTGSRLSKDGLVEIGKNLRTLASKPEYGVEILVQNAEKIVFRCGDDGTERTIFAYPSNPEKLR
jgi:hypothetical protein